MFLPLAQCAHNRERERKRRVGEREREIGE